MNNGADTAGTPKPQRGAGRLHPGIPAEVASRIRLVVLDVDGVLTDAGVYLGVGENGFPAEFKRFDIQDGLAFGLLRAAGIELAIVSGRVSEATAIRARELGIAECHQDPGARKLPVVRAILDRLGLDWAEAAMVGDDLPDIPVMRRVGLPVAVRNAVPEVRREVLWTTRRRGGRGAVREFAQALLSARGQWNSVVEDYVRTRSDV